MKNTFGTALGLTIFGESHGAAVGAVLDGLAAGLPVDEAYIAERMDRRRARGDGLSTARTEPDVVEFLSGVVNGHTTGTPITMMIRNTNTRSGDYAKTADLLRPGHADYTAYAKYEGWQDARGGGHFSGRITAASVAAGSICEHILAQRGIKVYTHIARCAGVEDAPLSSSAGLIMAEPQPGHFALLDPEKEAPMQAAIRAAGAEGDSVGGILETVITGVPAGIGEPFFDSVESEIAHLAFAIPAVKGIEFGAGFAFADLRGSQANDPFTMRDGKVATATNKNGGINGGIANGMPIVFRTAVKPTPSIYKEQDTVDYIAKADAKLQIKGLHNAYNAMAAALATLAAGIAPAAIRRSLYGFAPVEHRLEPVKESGGVLWINDSKATNVDSVYYALESMKRPVVWIAGGTDKGNDYGPLKDFAREKVHTLVCMGIDNAKLLREFTGVVPEVISTDSLDAAMTAAKAAARPGDAVLLSPACASFDLFKNYENRGELFKAWVNEKA